MSLFYVPACKQWIQNITNIYVLIVLFKTWWFLLGIIIFLYWFILYWHTWNNMYSLTDIFSTKRFSSFLRLIIADVSQMSWCCMFLLQTWGLPQHRVDWQHTDKQPRLYSERCLLSETTASLSALLPESQIWIHLQSWHCWLVYTRWTEGLFPSAVCTSTDIDNLCYSGSSGFVLCHWEDWRCTGATEWSGQTEKHLKRTKQRVSSVINKLE